MGELDISPALYERMTWREFEYKARGYFLRLARQKWMLREMVWNLWAVNGQDIERKDIMILPWDEEGKASRRKEYTARELEEIDKRFTAIQERIEKTA